MSDTIHIRRAARNKAYYGSVGMAPIVAMLVATQPAHAVLLSNASNTVSLCSGVQLPRSDVTSIVQPLTDAVAPLESTTNSLLGSVGSILGLPALNTNITGLMNNAAAGNITLSAVSTNGTIIGPSTGCYAQASGVTLASPAGIAIGGNALTGLGDSNQNVASAGEINSIAFGNNAATASAALGSIAIGTNASVGSAGVGSVALGNQAQATAGNSVALGANSSASRGALTNYTAAALTAPQTSVGEVSVGSSSGARQITNVAAGSQTNDAVNVAQLNAVSGAVTNVSNAVTNLSNLAVQYDTTNHTSITLGGGGGTSITNLRAGNLSSTSTDAVNGSQLNTTNNNITNISNNIVNGNIGIWRYSNSSTPTQPNSGVITNDITIVGNSGGAVGVHNVAPGVLSSTSTDAVNGSQLFATNQSITTLGGTVTNINNQVTQNTNNITNLGNSLTNNVNNINSSLTTLGNTVSNNTTNITNLTNNVGSFENLVTNGGVGPVQYSNALGQANGGTISSDVTLVGAGGGAIGLHNVAAGTLSSTSNDAVNGSQLFATNQSITTLGGTVTNINNQVTQNTSDITNLGNSLTNNVNTINSSLTTLNNNVSNNTTNITNLTNNVGSFENQVTNGGIGPVQYSNALGQANGGTISSDVTLVGAGGGAIGLHNVAAGTLSSTSNDAVNGSQLFATNQSITTLGGTVTNINNQVTQNTSDITNLGNSLTSNVNNINSSLTTLNSSVSNNTTNITNLTNNVGSFENQVTNGGVGPVQYSNALGQANGGTISSDVTLVGAGGGAIGLHNVAAGTLSSTSNDAVNGSQLFATNQSITTLGGTVTNINNQVTQNTNDITNLGNSLTNNVNNINSSLTTLGNTVSNNTTNITNLTNNVGSFENQVANGGIGPVQYSNGSGQPNGGVISQDVALVGAGSGPVGLHNVADGAIAAGSKDAVNGGQIFALSNNLSNLSDLAVTYDDSSRTNVTFGAAGTPVGLHNVAAGTLSASSNDAVNGAQLFATNQTISTLGNSVNTINNSITNLDNSVTSIDNRVTQNTSNISNIDARVTTNSNSITNIDGRVTLLANGGAGPLQYSNGGTTPNGGTVTQDVTLVGANGGPVAIHNVADGVIAHGSTDAVNGGQIADAIDTGITDLAVTYDDSAHSKVTLGGAGAPAVQLSNVAAGSVSATSTDAVNGAQLFATNQSITDVANNLSTVTNNYNTLNATVTQNSTDIANVTSNYNNFSSLVRNGGVGPVQYSNGDSTPNGGVPTQDLTLVGAASGPVALHNVAAGAVGAGSTDAINGGQLAGLGSAIASTLGNFSYSPATNSLSGNFTYGGNSYADVQSVLGAIHADETSGPSSDGKYFHANSVLADSSASGSDSTAVGPAASSAGVQSVAMGANATATSDQSVAIGSSAIANGGASVSIGQGNTASGNGAVALGDPSSAVGDGAVVAGKDDNATGTGAIAMGNTNTSMGTGATAIGNINTANGDGAVSLGTGNAAAGLGSIAIGSNNSVTGDGSLAIGSGIQTLANDTLAIGSGTAATQASAAAIGNRAQATGADSLAVGNDATATAQLTSTFGEHADATAQYATALGAQAQATGFAATAVGTGAAASGFASTAIGVGATALQDNSVALGSGVQTTRGAASDYTAFGLTDAQNSVGEVALALNMSYIDPRTGQPTVNGARQITGVAAGSALTDAVNVAQLQGTSATLGTAIASGLGGGSTYNSTSGIVSGPSYNLFGTSYTSVGDALTALATHDGGGTGGGTGTASATTVQYTDASQSQVNLATGGTTVHNVAAGNVATGSTDAVNGSQLAATNAQVAANSTAITTLGNQVQNGAIGTVQYSNAATPTQPNGGTKTNDVALVGANASAPVGLHNVADGTVAAGSTDAVNGGQLAATNSRVATVEATANSAMSMSQNSVQYDSGGGSVTLGGSGSTAPVALHNVGNGTSATDAVNLGQLASATNAAVSQSNAYTDARIASVQFDLGRVRKDSNAGTAGALAMAAMPQPYEAGKGMISAGMAAYQGQTAIAMGIAKALADEHTVIKMGATYNSRGQVAVNGGIGYQF